MKSVITVLAFLACISSSFAQSHTEQGGTNPPRLPQAEGEGWYKQNTDVTGLLNNVFFKNRDTGYANAGTTFTIFTTNGGSTWQTYSDKIAVRAFIGSFGYAKTTLKGDGWVAITTDNGDTWIDYNTGFDEAHNLYFSSPSRGFCYVSHLIGRTSDGGKTWILDTTRVGTIANFTSYDSLRVIASGGDYYKPGVAISAASVFLSTNGGETWRFTMKNIRENIGLGAIGAFDPSTIYFIGGTPPRISKSIDGGYLIPPCKVDDGGFTDGVAQDGSATDINNVTIVGSSGIIYRTTDGKTWKRQNSGTTASLESVHFVDSTHGWSVGDGGIIIHTSDAGKTWVKQTIPTPLTTSISPEPFGRKTSITYELPSAMKVKIRIYNVMGKELEVLESPSIQDAGTHSIEFDGSRYPEGTFHYKIETDGFYGTGKMTKVVY